MKNAHHHLLGRHIRATTIHHFTLQEWPTPKRSEANVGEDGKKKEFSYTVDWECGLDHLYRKLYERFLKY